LVAIEPAPIVPPDKSNDTDAGGRMRDRFFTIAICVVVLMSTQSRLAAAQSGRDTSSSRVVALSGETKSATTATVLSAFLPGLGHLYAEDRPTGVVLMTLFAGAVALGIGGENATAGPLALLIGAGPWFYGVIDAHNAAAEYNRAHASTVAGFTIRPMLTTGAGSSRVGVAVQLRY
jgi:hypothetical protein